MKNTKDERERISALNVREVVEGLMPYLAGWALCPLTRTSDGEERWPNIQHTSGAVVGFHRTTWPPAFHATAHWPRLDPKDPCSQEFAPRERMGISFSPFREPKSLAADIDRRLLRPFLPTWADQLKAANEAREAMGRALALAGTLASMLESRVRVAGEGFEMYSAEALIRITRWGTCYFERVSTDTPERAVELAALLAKWARDKAAAA